MTPSGVRRATPSLFLVVGCGSSADREHADKPEWGAEVTGSAGLVGEIDFDEATVLLEGDPGERLGTAIALGDFAGDGAPWLAVGAPNLPGSDSTAGQVRVYERISSGAGDRLELRATVLGTHPGEQFGSVLAVVDADRDGTDDLAVGWPGCGEDTLPAGGVAIFSGVSLRGELVVGDAIVSLLGTVDVNSMAATLTALPASGEVAPALVVGAPDERVQSPGPGLVYIAEIPAGASGVHALDATSWSTAVSGSELGDQLGRGVGRGDYDGDGLVDLLLGAPGTDLHDTGRGVAYLFRGTNGRPRDLSAADLIIRGDERAGGLGYTYDDGLGEADLDGDGYDELVVSRPSANAVIFAWSGAVLDFLPGQVNTSTATLAIAGASSTTLGEDLVEACDLDGDEAPDFFVGASGEGRKSNGVIWWFYGPLRPGGYDLDEADAWLEHDTKLAHMGRDGACVHDEGRPDSLVVGAHLYSDPGGPEDAEAGAVDALRGRYR